MKFLIELRDVEGMPHEIVTGIKHALVQSLRLANGGLLRHAPDVLHLDITRASDAVELLFDNSDPSPRHVDGHFYEWPNELVSMILNVHDDVARLRALPGAHTAPLIDLADSLTVVADRANKFMQDTSPGQHPGNPLTADVFSVLRVVADFDDYQDDSEEFYVKPIPDVLNAAAQTARELIALQAQGMWPRPFPEAQIAIAQAGATLQDVCHNAAREAGWWRFPDGTPVQSNVYAFSNKLALIHSEISEAMEGDRKGLMDDHLPHRPMREVELADAAIRIGDLAGAYNLDLGGAIAEKLAYNAQRADHKIEARAAAGGKTY